jgi:hypothetical protein
MSAPGDDRSLNSAPLQPWQDPGLTVLHAELGGAYAHFNGLFWQGRLPVPVIALFRQPPRCRWLGHYLPDAWMGADGTRKDELVIYADLALQRGIVEVLVTLVHEQVHVWQRHFGAPARRSHNAQWHAEAARVGLQTHGEAGFTEPSGEFLREVERFHPQIEQVPYRLGPAQGRTKGKLAKWTCACGYGVRVAVAAFDATCHRCGERFRRA